MAVAGRHSRERIGSAVSVAGVTAGLWWEGGPVSRLAGRHAREGIGSAASVGNLVVAVANLAVAVLVAELAVLIAASAGLWWEGGPAKAVAGR